MEVTTFFYLPASPLAGLLKQDGSPQFLGSFVLPFRPEQGDLFEIGGVIYFTKNMYTRCEAGKQAHVVAIVETTSFGAKPGFPSPLP